MLDVPDDDGLAILWEDIPGVFAAAQVVGVQVIEDRGVWERGVLAGEREEVLFNVV